MWRREFCCSGGSPIACIWGVEMKRINRKKLNLLFLVKFFFFPVSFCTNWLYFSLRLSQLLLLSPFPGLIWFLLCVVKRVASVEVSVKTGFVHLSTQNISACHKVICRNSNLWFGGSEHNDWIHQNFPLFSSRWEWINFYIHNSGIIHFVFTKLVYNRYTLGQQRKLIPM